MLGKAITLVAATLLLALGAVAPAQAQAQARIALIIANSEYDSLIDLTNPQADADLVASALRAVGFTVRLRRNLDRDDFFDAIDAFQSDLSEAGEDATGLFYYAGHGSAFDGLNYLMPVDANPASSVAFARDAVEVQDIYKTFRRARNGAHFVVLDACRNDGRTRTEAGAGVGLVRPAQTPAGVFTAFSADQGQVALDGPPGGVSPFAEAFAANIRTAQPAPIVFQSIATDVSRKTERRQLPLRQNGLIGDPFYFVAAASPPPEPRPEPRPAPAPRPDPAPGVSPADAAAWAAVQTDCDARAYLRAFPDGAYAEAANIRAGRCDPTAYWAAALADLGPDAVAAARAGDGGRSLAVLGDDYRTGTDGKRQDDGVAARLYEAACDRGFALGCRNLGFRYENGRGVAQDDARAATLYREACEGGDVAGCNNLGVLLDNHGGFSQNPRLAARFYRQACEGGFATGCYNLGVLYENGRGVAQDEARAATLYRQALTMDPDFETPRRNLARLGETP